MFSQKPNKESNSSTQTENEIQETQEANLNPRWIITQNMRPEPLKHKVTTIQSTRRRRLANKRREWTDTHEQPRDIQKWKNQQVTEVYSGKNAAGEGRLALKTNPTAGMGEITRVTARWRRWARWGATATLTGIAIAIMVMSFVFHWDFCCWHMQSLLLCLRLWCFSC